MTLRRIVFTLLIAGFLSTTLYAQFVPRIPLFEHFTQASCGPCAVQNPVFQDNILKQYRPLINHVAYHTSWPGVDPMNAHNPGEVAQRVNYYHVTGVPHMVLDGNVWEGGPAGVRSSLVDAEIARGAPIAVAVTLDKEQQPWEVQVTVTSVADVPSGDYRLFVEAVEENITYSSPPGSNGEKWFPNVFRKFLSASTGDPITLTAAGESQTFTYTVQPHTDWDVDSIYVLAFVQDYQTRTVLNSGSSLFRPLLLISQSPGITEISANSSQDLQFEIRTDAAVVAQVSVSIEAPEGWSVEAKLNGETIAALDTVQIDPASVNGQITVHAGEQPGYAIISFVVDPIDPDLAPAALKYMVLVGSDVVLLHSSQAFGDGKDHTQQLRSTVEKRMQKAGIAYMAIPAQEFLMARQAQLLSQVQTVFYAVGWTFPSLPDNLVVQLRQILDNGGNLFIAGQDIGWDTWDQSGWSRTSTAQSFYRDYLHARFIDDGTGVRSMIQAVADDPIFKTVGMSAIFQFYPGHIYPDALQPADSFAHPAFQYPDEAIAGLWAQKDDYKVVYLGIGIEQFGDENVAATVLSLAKQWFDGIISGVELQQQLQRLLIRGSELEFHFAQPVSGSLRIYDALGRQIVRVSLDYTATYRLSLEGAAAGVYGYQVVRNDGTVVQTGTLVVR